MPPTLSTQRLKTVVSAIQSIYPVSLADSSWDNTGLLVDASSSTATAEPEQQKVLLTVDLTQAVVEEAVQLKSQLIIAYHPFIFRGIKAISPASNPQHSSLVKLIQNGISVYCPHTSCDAQFGGVNDYICKILGEAGSDSFDLIKDVVCIEPSSGYSGNYTSQVGMGRVLTRQTAIPLGQLIGDIKQGFNIEHLQITSGYDTEKMIKKIAVCAGSGGSVFPKIKNMDEIDLIFTGELSHHEALMYKEMGKTVICVHHSNSERPFLKEFATQLLDKFASDPTKFGEPVEIEISTQDTDPLLIV